MEENNRIYERVCCTIERRKICMSCYYREFTPWERTVLAVTIDKMATPPVFSGRCKICYEWFEVVTIPGATPRPMPNPPPILDIAKKIDMLHKARTKIVPKFLRTSRTYRYWAPTKVTDMLPSTSREVSLYPPGGSSDESETPSKRSKISNEGHDINDALTSEESTQGSEQEQEEAFDEGTRPTGSVCEAPIDILSENTPQTHTTPSPDATDKAPLDILAMVVENALDELSDSYRPSEKTEYGEWLDEIMEETLKQEPTIEKD